MESLNRQNCSKANGCTNGSERYTKFPLFAAILFIAIIISPLMGYMLEQRMNKSASRGTQQVLQLTSPQASMTTKSLQLIRQTDAPPEWHTYYDICKSGKFYSNLRRSITESELSKAIKEFKEPENVCGLDLENSNLRNIPLEIRNLRSLKVLLLSFNRLTHVPPEIIASKNLAVLTLSHNSLTDVPSWIGNATNLQYLSLSFNGLVQTPLEIKKLSNLTLLDLTGNPMTQDEVARVRQVLPKVNVLFTRPMNFP